MQNYPTALKIQQGEVSMEWRLHLKYLSIIPPRLADEELQRLLFTINPTFITVSIM